MSKDTKILFPTEFGPLGEKAKENAVFLAKIFDAELVLLHALHLPSGFSKLFSSVSEDDLRKTAQKELDKYRQEIDPNEEIEITTMVKIGEPEESIVTAAKEIGAKLVIFGTKGGSGLRDTLLGSAVNHVIRNTPCPVITIRNKPEYVGFTRILVPVDLAREAGEKVAWGVDLAKRFNSALHFFSVVQGSADDLLKLEDRLKKSIDHAKSQGIADVKAELGKTDEPVADAILKYADRVDADLICIMTQQESESSLRSSILGTTADQLVNVSQRAVVSIRPERHYHSKSYQSKHFT